MSRPTIRIDVEDARELSALVAEEWPQNGANARLLAALARHDQHASKPSHKRTRAVSKPLMRALDSLMPYPKMVGEREKALRRAKTERRGETAAIRMACLRRAAGTCECGCGKRLNEDEFEHGPDGVAELEHPFSKGKGARLPQSVETCWILRADCHRERTANRPSAAAWWEKFIAHMESIGDAGRVSNLTPRATWYVAITEARKRLAFVEVRSSLPAAPRTRHRQQAEEKIQELESKIHDAVFGEGKP
jgi:hypothetical protein